MDRSSFESEGKHYQQTIGIERDAAKSLAQSFCFWVSSLLARAETIRQIGGFNPKISFVEDRDIFFRLSLVTSIAYVNKLLIRTDRTPSPPGSTCRPWDRHDVQFRQQQLMMEGWLKMDPPVPPDVRIVIERALGSLHSAQANWHLENSRFSEARDAMTSALKYKKTRRRLGEVRTDLGHASLGQERRSENKANRHRRPCFLIDPCWRESGGGSDRAQWGRRFSVMEMRGRL